MSLRGRWRILHYVSVVMPIPASEPSVDIIVTISLWTLDFRWTTQKCHYDVGEVHYMSLQPCQYGPLGLRWKLLPKITCTVGAPQSKQYRLQNLRPATASLCYRAHQPRKSPRGSVTGVVCIPLALLAADQRKANLRFSFPCRGHWCKSWL